MSADMLTRVSTMQAHAPVFRHSAVRSVIFRSATVALKHGGRNLDDGRSLVIDCMEAHDGNFLVDAVVASFLTARCTHTHTHSHCSICSMSDNCIDYLLPAHEWRQHSLCNGDRPPVGNDYIKTPLSASVDDGRDSMNVLSNNTLIAQSRPLHCVSKKYATQPATIIGPILWGHSGPFCHALSLLSSSSLLWTSMRRRRATVATAGEWQCGVRRLAVANGPNIFQMLLVLTLVVRFQWFLVQILLSELCHQMIKRWSIFPPHLYIVHCVSKKRQWRSTL